MPDPMPDPMPDELDPLLARAVDSLRTVPPMPDNAVAEVLWRVEQSRRARSRWRGPAIGGTLLLAATLAAMVLRAPPRGRDEPSAASSSAVAPPAAAGTVATPIVGMGDAPALVPHQFVISLDGARSVDVVGDFNVWAPAATPMQQLEGTNTWSVVVPLSPGRHAYAFLVDGTRWLADPRAVLVRDADFGRPTSAVVVGIP